MKNIITADLITNATRKDNQIMQINLYNIRLAENLKPALVKEKEIHYTANKVCTPKATADFFNDVFQLNEMAEEHCYMLAQNMKGMVLGVFLISRGTVNQTPVGVREIFIRILLTGASCIILCHNHPSTDCSPSRDDILITQKLKEACRLMDITLSDHIILGGSAYFSFSESGIL